MKKLLFAILILFFCMNLPSTVNGQINCLESAKEFYRNSDYFNAIEALNTCPDEVKNESYSELLASSYFQTGNLKSAYREAMVIADSVSGISLIYLKARITFARGDYETAESYYENLLQRDSLNNNYIRQLAVCADKLNNDPKAISYYRMALAMNPDDMVSGIRLVEKYTYADQLESADSLSLQLLQLDSLPELLRLRGDVLYRLKEYIGAWQCYEPLLKKGSSDPDLLRKAGVCKFVNGETDLAISLLSTSHLIKPDDEITCYYLAMAYQSKPDYKSAELYFKSAINNGISQNLGNYYQRMGDMYETSGNYVKALEAFQSALKYRDENDKLRPEIHYQLGRIYEVYFEDYKSAIRYYDYFLKSYADTADHKYKGIMHRKETLEKLVK